jgi:hypothetical protein
MTSNHLVLILDESGSMNTIRSDIIGGVNGFVAKQKTFEPHRNCDIDFTFAKFSEVTKVVYTMPLQYVPEVTEEEYGPSGCTALYDAVGITLEPFKDEYNVVVMIVTDGEENSSRVWSLDRMKKFIADQKQGKGWKFHYLSSDIDTWGQGNTMGISYQSNVLIGKPSMGSHLTTDTCNVVIGVSRGCSIVSDN